MPLCYMSSFFYAGLDVCEQFMDVSDMIRDEDLIVHKVNFLGNGIDQRVYASRSVHNIQQLVANMVPSVISKRPSAREMNLLKRKAKISSKDQTKCWSEDGDTEISYAQNLTTLKGQCPDSVNCDKVLDCTTSYQSYVGYILVCICFIASYQQAEKFMVYRISFIQGVCGTTIIIFNNIEH